MSKILEEPFFNPISTMNYTEVKSQMDRIELKQDKLLQNTIILKRIAEETQKKIDFSTNALFRAIFEATEVTTPTCFIMLPYKLPSGNENILSTENLEYAADYINKLSILNENLSNSIHESSYSISLIKSTIDKLTTSKYLYLYLIDEYFGTPVIDETNGVYPIEIRMRSKTFQKMVPFMQVGLTSMRILNGIGGLARIFGVPVPTVPDDLFKSGNDTLKNWGKGSNVAEYNILQTCVESEENEIEIQTTRGNELREFERFLEKEDNLHTYSGLQRVCSPNGIAIWTSTEGVVKIKESATPSNILKREEAIIKPPKSEDIVKDSTEKDKYCCTIN